MLTIFSLLFALFFVLLGIMTLLLPGFPLIRSEFVNFILSYNISLYLIGAGFLIVGLGVLAQIVHGMKRKYTTLVQKELTIDISEDVIIDYLKVYFAELFPLSDIPFRLSLQKKKAKLVVDLPHTSKESQKEIISKIQTDLQEIFRDSIGYRHELIFSFSFAPEKTLKKATN